MTNFWEVELVCKFCKHVFIVTENDVSYTDLKQEGFFVADFQYIVKCQNCDGITILSDIPSEKALEIQTRTYTENVDT